LALPPHHFPPAHAHYTTPRPTCADHCTALHTAPHTGHALPRLGASCSDCALAAWISTRHGLFTRNLPLVAKKTLSSRGHGVCWHLFTSPGSNNWISIPQTVNSLGGRTSPSFSVFSSGSREIGSANCGSLHSPTRIWDRQTSRRDTTAHSFAIGRMAHYARSRRAPQRPPPHYRAPPPQHIHTPATACYRACACTLSRAQTRGFCRAEHTHTYILNSTQGIASGPAQQAVNTYLETFGRQGGKTSTFIFGYTIPCMPLPLCSLCGGSFKPCPSWHQLSSYPAHLPYAPNSHHCTPHLCQGDKPPCLKQSGREGEGGSV